MLQNQTSQLLGQAHVQLERGTCGTETQIEAVKKKLLLDATSNENDQNLVRYVPEGFANRVDSRPRLSESM